MNGWTVLQNIDGSYEHERFLRTWTVERFFRTWTGSSERERFFMNGSAEHGLLLSSPCCQRLAALPLTQLSHIWLEGGSTWDPQDGLKMLISEFGTVLWLKSSRGRRGAGGSQTSIPLKVSENRTLHLRYERCILGVWMSRTSAGESATVNYFSRSAGHPAAHNAAFMA